MKEREREKERKRESARECVRERVRTRESARARERESERKTAHERERESSKEREGETQKECAWQRASERAIEREKERARERERQMEKERGGEYVYGGPAFPSGVLLSCIYFYAGKLRLCELVNQLNDNDGLQWVLFVGLWECGGVQALRMVQVCVLSCVWCEFAVSYNT